MHAAIDQLCEKWIASNNAQELVQKAFQNKYCAIAAPQYAVSDSGDTLPEGNNGLGLQLLGLSGDEVLPPDVYATIKAQALSSVRGTVQADILKEDQAQNTCIFLLSLRLN